MKGDIPMSLENYVPSKEYKDFEKQNGEDTFIKLNLLYLAFAMNEIYSDEKNKEGEFDELCRDVLDMYLDDQFDSYNIIDIAEGTMFIIKDSNYTIKEYVRTYERNHEKICEELLAYLDKARRQAVRN